MVLSVQKKSHSISKSCCIIKFRTSQREELDRDENPKGELQ
jgi:hypothetical protein